MSTIKSDNTNSDNHRGYIQNLSPIKRSRNQNQWFDFDLQTSPSKLRRVVGFNIASHSTLQEHEASKTAVTFKTLRKMTIIKSYSTNNQWSGLRQPLTLILTISPSINLKRLYPQLSLPKRLHLKSSPHFKSIRK
ncbi:unnamed protein product [Porites lobata]|uniref:Uncharacterized protein n=1 Tax=Porites lobata TaxID=104759 RepID=A0ABN8PTN5_9CNID|nr:unnamed protein product [Porites lobata]